MRYKIVAPKTPGAQPSKVGEADTLPAAREAARLFCSGKRWLTRQDCRIDLASSGRLVEYAGPAR